MELCDFLIEGSLVPSYNLNLDSERTITELGDEILRFFPEWAGGAKRHYLLSETHDALYVFYYTQNHKKGSRHLLYSLRYSEAESLDREILSRRFNLVFYYPDRCVIDEVIEKFLLHQTKKRLNLLI